MSGDDDDDEDYKFQFTMHSVRTWTSQEMAFMREELLDEFECQNYDLPPRGPSSLVRKLEGKMADPKTPANALVKRMFRDGSDESPIIPHPYLASLNRRFKENAQIPAEEVWAEWAKDTILSSKRTSVCVSADKLSEVKAIYLKFFSVDPQPIEALRVRLRTIDVSLSPPPKRNSGLTEQQEEKRTVNQMDLDTTATNARERDGLDHTEPLSSKRKNSSKNESELKESEASAKGNKLLTQTLAVRNANVFEDTTQTLWRLANNNKESSRLLNLQNQRYRNSRSHSNQNNNSNSNQVLLLPKISGNHSSEFERFNRMHNNNNNRKKPNNSVIGKKRGRKIGVGARDRQSYAAQTQQNSSFMAAMGGAALKKKSALARFLPAATLTISQQRVLDTLQHIWGDGKLAVPVHLIYILTTADGEAFGCDFLEAAGALPLPFVADFSQYEDLVEVAPPSIRKPDILSVYFRFFFNHVQNNVLPDTNINDIEAVDAWIANIGSGTARVAAQYSFHEEFGVGNLPDFEIKLQYDLRFRAFKLRQFRALFYDTLLAHRADTSILARRNNNSGHNAQHYDEDEEDFDVADGDEQDQESVSAKQKRLRDKVRDDQRQRRERESAFAIAADRRSAQKQYSYYASLATSTAPSENDTNLDVSRPKKPEPVIKRVAGRAAKKPLAAVFNDLLNYKSGGAQSLHALFNSYEKKKKIINKTNKLPPRVSWRVQVSFLLICGTPRTKSAYCGRFRVARPTTRRSHTGSTQKSLSPGMAFRM